MPQLARLLRYLWAAPNTAIGLGFALFATLFGARWQIERGAIEVAGGAVGRLVASLRAFSAITLGHVILAVDRGALRDLRAHEHVHVRQYERWGPLFLPAYLGSSLLQWLRGRDPYRENHFEQQAYAATAAPRARANEDRQ